jgi:ATP-dependent Zn protease
MTCSVGIVGDYPATEATKLQGVLFASTAGDLLTGLLPFVLLFGFWMFIMRRARGTTPQDGVVEKLEEIRQELEQNRKAIESRP